MFTVCVGFVFRSKYGQFPIICSLQYSININTVEVDPHSDLLHICLVKPTNCIPFPVDINKRATIRPYLATIDERSQIKHCENSVFVVSI